MRWTVAGCCRCYSCCCCFCVPARVRVVCRSHQPLLRQLVRGGSRADFQVACSCWMCCRGTAQVPQVPPITKPPSDKPAMCTSYIHVHVHGLTMWDSLRTVTSHIRHMPAIARCLFITLAARISSCSADCAWEQHMLCLCALDCSLSCISSGHAAVGMWGGCCC